MKLDRRGFIKFMAGGALGTILSPIPWKLIDDVAIWTQNWSWVPNPPRGENGYRNAVSPIGYRGTGISVRLVDGKRGITLSGVPDNPLTEGGLGPVDVCGLQYHYNKAIRVPGPMKLENGIYKPISWREGLTTLVRKLKEIRAKGAPERVAAVSRGLPGTMDDLFRRFLTAYGSPNYMTMPAASDTEAQILKLMYGAEGSVGYDLEHADYILTFGAGLLEGWGSQRSLLAFRNLKEKPGSLPRWVHVATNCSMSSTMADEWVAVAPGTEGALALGIAHVLIRDGLVDGRFLERNAFGFDQGKDAQGSVFSGFRRLVMEEYDPETVSHITGVPVADIVRTAWELGRSKRGVALPGRGKGAMPGGLYEFMAVHSLNALVGAVNRTGGVGPVPAPPLAPWPKVSLDAQAEQGLQRDRIDGAGTEYPFAESLVHRFAEVVSGEKNPPVDLLLVYDANPVYGAPSAKMFSEAVEKIPFVVSFSTYWSETARKADLILPNHSFMERWEDGTTPYGTPFPVYVLGAPVFPPRFQTRHTADLLLQAARDLGGSVAASFPWKTYEEVLKYRVQGLYRSQKGLVAEPGSLAKPAAKGFSSFEDLWNKLAAYGCWYDPGRRIGKGSLRFSTPSGKFELYSNRIRSAKKRSGGDLGVQAKGEAAYMAHYEPVRPLGDAGEYPLLLMPEDLAYVHEGEAPSAAYLTKIWPDTLLSGKRLVVEINPDTARKWHLGEGDTVIMESECGRATVKVHLFHGVRPGVVSMAEGFGHTAFDEYIRNKGSNTREMTRVVADPLSGMPLWWGTRVKLWKA